jgi:TonB family protein
MVVRRTSGYPKLDESAIKALKQWKFVALTTDENREEVGQITFNYSLN